MTEIWAFGSAVVMATVGWMVQAMVYPAFREVRPEAFAGAHSRHTARIGILVVPAMLVEAASMIALLRADDPWSIAGAACGGFAILWTFAVSAPLHGRLSKGPDPAVIDRLIQTNLPRALAWTGHAAISAWMLIR